MNSLYYLICTLLKKQKESVSYNLFDYVATINNIEVQMLLFPPLYIFNKEYCLVGIMFG